jgi:hypothetical protein
VPLQVLGEDHSCHVSNLHLSIGAPPEGQGLLRVFGLIEE